MKNCRTLFSLAACAAAIGLSAKAQEIVLDGPFKTVHLMIVTPVQEAFLTAAVSDFNHEFAKEGCSTCAYRLFKMVIGKQSKYNYMMTADWPNSDAYIKIHASKGYAEVTQKNPILDELSKTEFYGRYAEVK